MATPNSVNTEFVPNATDVIHADFGSRVLHCLRHLSYEDGVVTASMLALADSPPKWRQYWDGDEGNDFYNPKPEEIAHDEINGWYMKALETNLVLQADDDHPIEDMDGYTDHSGIHLPYTVDLAAECGKTEFEVVPGGHGRDEIDLSKFDSQTKPGVLKAIQRVKQFVAAAENDADADLEMVIERYCKALKEAASPSK